MPGCIIPTESAIKVSALVEYPSHSYHFPLFYVTGIKHKSVRGATGSIQAQEADGAISADKMTGERPKPSATAVNTGTNNAVIAVLLANSVRKTINPVIITKMFACATTLATHESNALVAFSTLHRYHHRTAAIHPNLPSLQCLSSERPAQGRA